MPLILAMSTALPERVLRRRCRDAVRKPWPHFSDVTVGLKPRQRQELERREHAAVDLAELDVLAAAARRSRCAGRRARGAAATPCPSAGPGRSTARRRPRTGSRRRRGRSRSSRAASSRRGSASGRSRGAAAGGADREGQVRRDAVGSALPMRPRIVPAMTLRAGLERLERDVLGLRVDAEDGGDAAAEDLEGALGRLALRGPAGRRRPAWRGVRNGLANRRSLSAVAACGGRRGGLGRRRLGLVGP